ncbi:unnamed protein product [[Candida] boidinii]|nr:unnamed protein product [[Candida] boidinii]
MHQQMLFQQQQQQLLQQQQQQLLQQQQQQQHHHHHQQPQQPFPQPFNINDPALLNSIKLEDDAQSMRSMSTTSSAPISNFTDMSPMTTKNISKLNSLSPSASIEKTSTTSSDQKQKKKDDSSSSFSTTTTKRKVWRIKKYKDDSERQSTLIQQATQIAGNNGELSRNGIRKLNVRPKINRNGEPMKFLFVDVSPQTGDKKSNLNSNKNSESKLRNSINSNNNNNNDSDSIGSGSNSLNRNSAETKV